MALLHILDASGREWKYSLRSSTSPCTIGRAPDNCIVVNDPRTSRYHAHIVADESGFKIVDGIRVGGDVRRSANKVFVNGNQAYEHQLSNNDRITIGTSVLRFEQRAEEMASSGVRYDDKRLGHTQVLVSATDLISTVLRAQAQRQSPASEVEALRRKAEILEVLYEMSQTLGSVFDLDAIFNKATEIIFRVTPADRVVALLADGADPQSPDASLRPIALRVRDEQLAVHAKNLTIGRTITRQVMRDRVALLSQDAAADERLRGVESIVSQGVRSTICAPLVVEHGVHGALYADRLDPFAVFTRDDLELISAIAAQTAVAVENARNHERLAREQVVRASYGRFVPEYVVNQMLENPESFQLGGANQLITVLFADIRGFTRLAEHARPEQVVHLLNRYFTAMTEIIFAHDGTLDKYLGDGLMALFGAPQATPQDAANAVAAAVQMQRRMEVFNEELRTEGIEQFRIGVGLHTGEATVGYIGSERRSEYTAIGDTVNLAARLESNASGGQILMTEATAQAAAESPYVLRPREAINVKNRVQPVPLYEVDWQKGEEGRMTGEK
ncbi:MAG: adenylate/guanylate cyclase domain-containing protein [Pyrinomonadaceae bacterium]